LNGKRPIIYGDGEQTRDFTYVENVVEANILACFKEGIDGEIFNIAYGKATSVNKLFWILRELTGRNLEPIYEPPRPAEVHHSFADISKAEEKLGYRPVIDLAEGLKRTILYFKKETKQ
jgi:UDP-glucose 4-epimerase